MNKHFQNFVLKTTGATAIRSQELIQTLWSSYGEIVRVKLTGSNLNYVVVKYIVLPSEYNHPRGWNTDHAHARKIKSYDVEMYWYRNWGARCGNTCRIAQCYTATKIENERIIVLEDLDTMGFSVRRSTLDQAEVKLCLSWLAHFHATFMNEKPEGLWKTGTYWHLATRPDEWAAMAEGDLKQAAIKIDQRLNRCNYQTLLHGDAKVNNFCFSLDSQSVAAVDFQYVGAGCGMKDVIYFLGSCLSEQQCEQWQTVLLEYYFSELKQALERENKQVNWKKLEAEWMTMFAIAWTDFYRFLVGWMPTHHKINSYSQRLAADVIADLL